MIYLSGYYPSICFRVFLLGLAPPLCMYVYVRMHFYYTIYIDYHL